MESMHDDLAARDGRPAFGAQVEAAFALWRAGLPSLLPLSLLYLLAGLLPWLTVRPLRDALLGLAAESALALATPFGTTPDPATLVEPLRAWLLSGWTLALFVAAFLAIVFAVTALLLHLQSRADREARAAGALLLTTLSRYPASLAAWLAYTLVMLLALVPVGLAIALFLWAAWHLATWTALAAAAAVFFVGALLASAPLAWASVAFGFAPVVAALEGGGPLATMRASREGVRGRWLRAAMLVTLPWLIYLGAAGAVSTLAMALAAGAAYASGGWPVLFAGEWLAWGQIAALLPTAVLVPLPYAGLLVAWRDLHGLHGIQGSP